MSSGAIGWSITIFAPTDADRHHVDPQPPGRRQGPPDTRSIYPRMLDIARGVIRSVYRHPRPYQAAGVLFVALMICLAFGAPFTRWLNRRVLVAQPTRSPKHAATVSTKK